REPAPRIPGMPGDKDEIAVLYSAGRPFEIVVKMCGLVVFVDSEKRDVQIVAGIGEIIRIPAKKRDVKFWSENQTHIGVLLVLVEVKDLAGVEDDDIAAQARRSAAVLFDPGHGGALCLSRIGSGHARLDPRVDLVGDVLDAHQLIKLEIWAFDFFGAGLGVKAGLDVVVARGGKLLHTAGADVVVREGQSVGGNEGSRAPIVKADGG